MENGSHSQSISLFSLFRYFAKWGAWTLSLLILSTLLLIFQTPFLEFKELRKKSKILSSISNVKHSDWEEQREPLAFEKTFQKLSKNKIFCESPINVLPFWGSPSELKKENIPAKPGSDFREYAFELRVDPLDSASCPSLENGSLFKSLGPRLLNQPFLLEANLIRKEKDQDPVFLNFGFINGTSAVFLDGKMIAYFPERIESSRILPLPIEAGKHRLSLLIYSKGFSWPGISSARFAGIIGADHSSVDLFPNPFLREGRSLLTILSSMIFSFLLLIFSIHQRKNAPKWTMHLSTLLLAYAIQQSLELDHVQSNLDGIRYFRAFSIIVFFSSLLSILGETLTRMKSALDNVPRSVFGNEGSTAISVFFGGGFFLLYTAWVGSFFLVINKLQFIPGLRSLQYDVLLPLTALSLTFSAFLVIGSFFLENWARKSARDEIARLLNQAKKISVTSGVLLIVYLLSYQELLTSWLKLRRSPSLSLLLGSQGAPFLVGFVALVMLARMLRDQALYERILPPSVLEVIPDARNRDLDRTESEQGWVLLNDLVGSTKLKLSNLAIVTHLLQSVLHKIHKTYFEDSIHFVTSLGDALILTLRSPKVLKREDPILEKFSRVYSLHRDGARELTDAHFTLLSLLRLQSHELALALNSIPQNTSEHLSFRTILCSSYYFYGLNSELSSLDSKILYLISKSEKLLTDSHQGGFIIFGSLWNTLSSAIPEIAPHFEKKLLDRENAPESIRQDLPECVMRLKPGEEERFEKALEKTLGEPIPSRIRREIRESISKTAQSISKAESLELLVKIPIPELQNFSEKNLILRAISERASELEAWHTPKLHEKILARTFAIGVPAMGLLKAVSERDHRYEPARLIADLHSKSAKTRNLAMRFLRLARVKGPFRPSAPDPSDFCSKAIGAWLKNPSLFSVESHFAMYEWLASDPIRQEMLNQSLRTAEAKDLHQYLNNHPAPSLQALSLMLNHHSIPSAKKAA